MYHCYEEQLEMKISKISRSIASSTSIVNEKLKDVQVFKTNVSSEEQAKTIVCKILDKFPTHKVNFDLDDCDNILRIEGIKVNPKSIINIMINSNYQCCLLM